jgi:chemotaxis protein histidine kinase CheA
MARFPHAMEGHLDRMRSGAVAPSTERIGLLLETLNTLRRLLDAARTGAEAPAETAAATQSLLVAQRAVAA